MTMPQGKLQAIYGAFGGGKTLRCMEKICELYDVGYRKLITNIHVTADHAGWKGGKCPAAAEFAARCPELEIVWMTNDEIKLFWIDPRYSKGCIVVVDEVHCVYDAAEWRAEKGKAAEKNTSLVGYWSQVRKSCDQVIGVSQVLGGFPTFLRFRIKRAERRFSLGPFFCSRTWNYEGGQVIGADKLGRMVPKKFFTKFYGYYMTHAPAGVVFDPDEEVSEFKPRRRSKVAIAVAAVILIAAASLPVSAGVWVYMKYWPKRGFYGVLSAKGVPASPQGASLVPGAGNGHVLKHFGKVAPLVADENWSVEYTDGGYHAVDPTITVLRVDDNSVLLGDSFGRVRTIPRPDSLEYHVIVAQRFGDDRNSVFGGPANGAGPPRGRSTVGSATGQAAVLPR